MSFLPAPNPQSLDPITAATGLGAFVIGGVSQGGGSQWGQGITETFVRGLYELPTLTLTNMLQVLEAALLKLPMEALQQFQVLFPNLAGINWSDPVSAVNGILSQVVPRPIMQSIEEFENWVGTEFAPLQTIIQQLLDILNGAAVTPVNTGVQAFKDGWTNITTVGDKLVHMTTDGYLPASAVQGVLDLAQLPGTVLTDASSIAAGAITGTIPLASLPGEVLTEASQIAATSITGVLSLAQLPVSLLTTASQLVAGNLTGTVPLANLPGSLLTTASTIAASAITGTLNLTQLPASILTTASSIALSQLPANLLTTASSIAATALTGTVPLANLPGTLLTTASSIAATAITGTLNLAQLPSSVLTTASQIISSQAPWAAPIDSLMNAWGRSGTGFAPADLIAQASTIPHDAVVGLLGQANVGGAVQTVNDAIAQGLGAVEAGINASAAQAQQVLAQFAAQMGFVPHAGNPPANSVTGIVQATSQALNNRAVQKPTYDNYDATMDAVFPFNDIKTINPLPSIPVTQGATRLGYITIRDGGVKQSIGWLGYGTANLSSFVLNVYSVDPTAKTEALIYTSPNIVGSLSAGSVPVWQYFNLPALNYLSTTPGSKYAVEIAVAGSGTYTLVGKTIGAQTPTHPSSFPAYDAATRNPAINYNTAVQYDAVGAGWQVATNQTTLSGSFAHTVGNVANPAVVVFLNIQSSSFNSVSGSTVKYNGVEMMYLGQAGWYGNTAANGVVAAYGLWGKDVTPNNTANVTFNMPLAGTATTARWQSVSLANVGSLAYGNITNNATYVATGPANTVTSDNLMLTAMGGIVNNFGSGAPWVSPNGTVVENTYVSRSSTNFMPTLIQYQRGTGASMTASATSPTTGSAATSNSVLSVIAQSAPAVIRDNAATTTGHISGQATTTTSISWTQNASTGTYVVAGVIVGGNGSSATPTCTATYGGVPMTLLGSRNQYNTSGYGYLFEFGLFVPNNLAGSNQTITATATATSAVFAMAGTSASYFNVLSVGSYYTNSGSGGTLTLAITGVANALAVGFFSQNAPSTQVLGNWYLTGSASAMQSGQSGHPLVSSVAGTIATDVRLDMFDVNALGATTINAVPNPTGNTWGASAVILNPIPAPAPATAGNPATAGTPFAYSVLTPFIGLSGSAGVSQYTPQPYSFNYTGSTQTWTPPSWLQYIDTVIWGGGGGGTNSNYNFGGAGGHGATPTVLTLSKAQFTAGAAWTITVGGGGGSSGTGGNTTIVIPGYGTVTAAGATSKNSFMDGWGFGSGDSAGNANFTDANGVAQTAAGGAGGGSPQAGGGTPGGGGAGGQAAYTNSNIYAGPGGNGAAYLRAY